ncbi:cobyric acid synthase [compost metagenome]
MGKSQTTEKAFIKLGNEGVDGAVSKDSKVIGTYFHGIFDNEEFTLRYLNKVRLSFNIAEEKDSFNYRKYKNEQYDKLASIVRESLDMKKIYSILDEGTKCQ